MAAENIALYPPSLLVLSVDRLKNNKVKVKVKVK
jgi:hypothetical protein